MKKLLKYELKGTFKFILMVLLTIVLSSTVAQVGIFRLSQMGGNDVSVKAPVIGVSLITIACLVIWAAFLVAFFYIVNNYNKELLEDRGYLTFTLPLKGKDIVGSKVLASLIEFAVLILGTVVFNLILGTILIKIAGIDIFEELLRIQMPVGTGKFITLMIIYGLISAVVTLITIYFSMTIRKVIFGGRKFNAMWFILFLVINGVVGVFGIKIMQYFPTYFAISEAGKFAIMSSDIFNGAEMIPSIFNIANLVYTIVIGIVLFVVTSLLLDKKIEI